MGAKGDLGTVPAARIGTIAIAVVPAVAAAELPVAGDPHPAVVEAGPVAPHPEVPRRGDDPPAVDAPVRPVVDADIGPVVDTVIGRVRRAVLGRARPRLVVVVLTPTIVGTGDGTGRHAESNESTKQDRLHAGTDGRGAEFIQRRAISSCR